MAKQNQDVEKLVKQIRDFQTELDAIKKGLSSTLGDQSTAISNINSELNKTISAFKKIRNAQNLVLDKQTKQLQETKSLADVYKQIPDSLSGFKSRMMDTLSISEKLTASAKAASGAKKAELTAFASTYNQTLSLATELSSLNKEDTLERSIQNNEIEKSLNLLQTQADAYALINGKENETFQNLQKQIEALKNIVLEANSIANTSKEIKDIYSDVYGDLNNLNTQFKKIAATVEVFFSSFKNMAGMSLIYIGGLVDDFNDLSKSVGGTVGQMFQLKSQSFLVSKLLGDDAAKGVTSLAEKLGDANDVTLKLSLGVGALTGRLGVSGEEAATLVNQFGNLSGRSSEFAMNTLEAASQLASANGVAPAGVMKDIAENTEFFALYSKNGGSNIAEAAVQAKRLGVDLATASKISDGLLDYQSSVAAEMEASVILGKNINLNKARELAFAGDSAGAMKAAIEAAGTLAELEAMNPVEREALAKAIGVSNAELMQMVANEKKALTPVGQLEGSFNSITATVREMGAGITGTAVKGIGGMLIGMKDFKTQVSDAKEGFTFLKDMGKGIGGLFTKRNFSGFKGITDSADTSAIKNLGKGGAITPTTPKGAKGAGSEAKTAAGQKQLAGGFTAMGEPGVRKGIINSALAGPALFLLSLGTPGMMAVGAFGMKAGKGLTSLVPGLVGFGAVPISAVGTLAATGAALLLLSLGTPGMMAVGAFGATAGKGLSKLAVGLLSFAAVPLLAVGTLAATAGAFILMIPGAIGMGLFGLAASSAAAGLNLLGPALVSFGATAGTFGLLGVGVILALAGAFVAFGYGLSLMTPAIQAIGVVITSVITSIATGISVIVGSITSMMTALLPLLSIDSALGLLAMAGGFAALSASLMAFAGASLLALPGLLAVGGFMALGGDVMLGGNSSGGEGGDSGLIEEIRGLRADIKNLAVVVSLDSRQIYKGHVQNIKNNSQR
jgi:archaellum component FlaC